MPLPKIRPLDIFPIKNRNRTMYVVRDPEAITKETVILSGESVFIASMLNGKNETIDIQVAFAQRFGGYLITTDEIMKLIGELDSLYLLETENYQKRKRELMEEFAKSSVRLPHCAGVTYPANPGELWRMLESFFSSITQEEMRVVEEVKTKDILGVISPHIDYARGGHTYALSYKVLEGCKASCFIILGVGHLAPPFPYVLTKKDFFTPLGTCQVNTDAVIQLLKNYNFQEIISLENEMAHRIEHSIELQLPFLQFITGSKHFTIVPVICSLFDTICAGKDPWQVPEIQEFINALLELIKQMGDDVCVVAGADLSHIGPRFGDSEPVDSFLVSSMEVYDKRYLGYIENPDPQNFYTTIMEQSNKTRICGLGAIYTLLSLKPSNGKILQYTYGYDPAGGVVSFISAALFR